MHERVPLLSKSIHVTSLVYFIFLEMNRATHIYRDMRDIWSTCEYVRVMYFISALCALNCL